MATEPIQIPENLTLLDIQRALARFCDDEGWLFGVPMPAMGAMQGRRLTIAKGVPRKDYFDREQAVEALAETDISYELKGSWYTRQEQVAVVRDHERKQSVAVRVNLTERRLQLLVETVACRSNIVPYEAEIKAMRRLMESVNDHQWFNYILSGTFGECSNRSGVSYIFRKGLPTIAMKKRESTGKAIFLAALCMHPMAYYDGTFCGSMCPTDEVLAHLLMMRGDEHKFWAKSNQHAGYVPESGL